MYSIGTTIERVQNVFKHLRTQSTYVCTVYIYIYIVDDIYGLPMYLASLRTDT